jgi:hypothetical protein
MDSTWLKLHIVLLKAAHAASLVHGIVGGGGVGDGVGAKVAGFGVGSGVGNGVGRGVIGTQNRSEVAVGASSSISSASHVVKSLHM